MKDIREEIKEWKDLNDLSYDKIYKPLGFNTRAACQLFLNSRGFVRYLDLASRFEELLEVLEEEGLLKALESKEDTTE